MVMAARLSVHRTQARDLTTVRNTPPETLKWLGSHSWEPFFHLWADPIVSERRFLPTRRHLVSVFRQSYITSPEHSRFEENETRIERGMESVRCAHNIRFAASSDEEAV